MQGKYLKSFDGAKIYYRKTVKNPDKWLLFLHGFGGDLTAWQRERQHFAKQNISTIAMDLRGHGLSEKSSDEDFYKLENFAKDVQLLLEKEKIKDSIIIGHCFGGMIATYYQAKHGKTSKALILVDTSYKPPYFSENNEGIKMLLGNFFNLIGKLFPNLQKQGHADFEQFIGTPDIDIKRIFSDMLHTSLKSYFTICKSLVNLDLKNLLDEISVPTLVVEGTKDSIFPIEIAKYLAKRIKKSELELIKGANHILVLNNPKELNQTIESFLNKISFT